MHNDKEVTSFSWCIVCYFTIIDDLWLIGGQKEIEKKAQIKFGRPDFAFIRLDKKAISLFCQNCDTFFQQQKKELLLGSLSSFYLNIVSLLQANIAPDNNLGN